MTGTTSRNESGRHVAANRNGATRNAETRNAETKIAETSVVSGPAPVLQPVATINQTRYPKGARQIYGGLHSAKFFEAVCCAGRSVPRSGHPGGQRDTEPA